MLRGELAACDELFVLVAPPLRRQLRGWAPPHRPELIEDAVDQAMATYALRPGRYEPERGDLTAWLARVARNALMNGLRPVRRRRPHEVPLTDELSAVLAAPVANTFEDLAERGAWLEQHRRELLAVARTDEERLFLEARLRGAPVAERAAILGGADLPAAEQRTLVNRVWERLMVRLRRARAGKGAPRKRA